MGLVQAAKAQCISPSSEDHGEVQAVLKGATDCTGNRTTVHARTQ